MPIKFVGEPFCVSKEFWYRKFSSKEGRSFTVLSKIFLSHRTEKTSPGNHSVFQKISGREKYSMEKRGVSRFSVKLSCLSVPKTFVRESYCFWKKILVPKSIMDERGVSRFSVENFWSHSAEKFRGHPFNVSENLGYRKILCIIGSITFFRRKFLVSQCRKISWASLQCFRKFGVSKNFMHNREYHVFPSKIPGLAVPKNFVGIPSMFQKN